MNISEQYNFGHISGWAGEEIAKEAFKMLSGSETFKPFTLGDLAKADRKMFLWQAVRKVLGKDTENYPQQIGDCTSFMGKNGGEYLECAEIAIGGEREIFKPLFPPYIYGCERVFVGQGRLGGGDGGVGVWVAESATKYGQIASHENNCPTYSGSVAKSWGAKGPPKELVDLGKQHVIKSAAPIKSWDECVTAVCNGFPVGICSNRGFAMLPDSQGFHNPQGTWNHAMTIVGVDDTYKIPFCTILNSWGSVMGDLFDFDTKEKWPVGTLRVRADVVAKMIAQEDTFAYSNFDGFPDQTEQLQKALFKMN